MLDRWMKSLREERSPVHMKRMSSMKRFHNRMWCDEGLMRVVSMCDIKILAYGGAVLVPMAVPWIWR